MDNKPLFYIKIRRREAKSTKSHIPWTCLRTYGTCISGQEVPPNGCARDEIRFGTVDGPCIQALAQGTCADNQWILFDNVTNVVSRPSQAKKIITYV